MFTNTTTAHRKSGKHARLLVGHAKCTYCSDLQSISCI